MRTTKPLSRRCALARFVALTAPLWMPGTTRVALAQARPALEPTPRDAEGPFYPQRLPADADFDLTRVAGRDKAAQGTPLLLAGRVLQVSGNALAGARVELWQCDATGTYHHVGGSVGDENFQGYGAVSSDSEGRYAFRTIRPVPYSGRPPHLHFRISHPRAQTLTTQLYPRGESAERMSGFGLSSREARSRLEFAMVPAAEAGSLAATYDFILRTN